MAKVAETVAGKKTDLFGPGNFWDVEVELRNISQLSVEVLYTFFVRFVCLRYFNLMS